MRGIKSFPIACLLVLYCVSAAHPYGFWDPDQTGNYRRWSADDIPVDYVISTWQLPDATEPVGAIYAAFQAWENVSNSSISFNYQGKTDDTFPEMGFVFDDVLGV